MSCCNDKNQPSINPNDYDFPYFISHNAALSIIKASVTKPISDGEIIAIDEAYGRVCAKNIKSSFDLPHFDNSAVDGYGFVCSEYENTPEGGEVSLKVIGSSKPGFSYDGDIQAGEAIYILTGAEVPSFIDCVIMQEDVQRDCESYENGNINFLQKLHMGANIRRAGEDIKKGDDIISRGKLIDIGDITALSAIGVSKIEVYRKLRLEIFSSGNELLRPGAAASKGKIYDSNQNMLYQILAKGYVSPKNAGILKDDYQSVVNALKSASLKNDLIIISAGSSQGDEDYVAKAIAELGEIYFWKIRVKPGKPVLFGKINSCFVMGLPGNPLAAFNCALNYTLELTKLLSSQLIASPFKLMIPANFEITNKTKGRREYLRGKLIHDDEGKIIGVDKYTSEGSHMISSLLFADGIIEISEELESLQKGELVCFIHFSAYGL